MNVPSAHVDSFARDRLPAPHALPTFVLDRPELRFAPRLNAAVELLDRHVAEGRGERVAIVGDAGVRWTYRELQARVDRIAHVLTREMGVVPGNRVLLRAPNSPAMAACWFAVVKAGAIAVATMPLLRAKELAQIASIGRIGHALCDARLAGELRDAAAQLAADGAPGLLATTRFFGDAGDDPAASLDAAAARAGDAPFPAVDTAADDVALLAFTSGTTGVPKATMHVHRDLLAICRCWPPHVLRPTADDVFLGSPPLAFTFGLGGLLLFPLSVGACAALVERVSPAQLVDAVREHGATILFTSPTAYRAMAARGAELRATRLRKCVSAGEVLPAATRRLWREAVGIELIDGIGTTEMLHIFISADEADARDGATGRVVPGYEAEVVDDDGRPVADGEVGRLRVRGPTGCRYLDDPRQASYVKDGWNHTGDAYWRDADGYFHFHARTDDLIVSSGYNIAAPEVEDAVLSHPAVAECAVIGVPDDERGRIVRACVVVRPGVDADAALAASIQDHVKATIAPYKYPRSVVFVDQLPKTPTGKLQRFRLRDAP